MGSAQTPPAVVRFGVFEADLRAGQLKRNGIRVRLQDLPFRALTLLLTRPGEVIAREEFRQVLWPPDVYVDFEQGISSAMMRLRDALDDSADNPIFVETIERRGYRWIGPVNLPQPVSQELPQEKDSQEQEEDSPAAASTATPTIRSAAPAPSRSSLSRKLVLVLPVTALLLAVWLLRPNYHDAKAGAKSAPPHPQ